MLVGILLAAGCGGKQPRKATSREGNDFSRLSDVECIQLLDHRNPLVRRQAVGELASRGSRVVPKVVEELRRPENSSAKSAAAEVLVLLGPAGKEAVPALTRAAADINWPDRYLAVRALGEIPASSEDAVRVLIQRLETDPEERVRAAAARSLGKIAAASELTRSMVLPALLAALKKPDPLVQAELAEALGLCGHGSPEVIKALKELANSGDFILRQAAQEALQNLEKRP